MLSAWTRRLLGADKGSLKLREWQHPDEVILEAIQDIDDIVGVEMPKELVPGTHRGIDHAVFLQKKDGKHGGLTPAQEKEYEEMNTDIRQRNTQAAEQIAAAAHGSQGPTKEETRGEGVPPGARPARRAVSQLQASGIIVATGLLLLLRVPW